MMRKFGTYNLKEGTEAAKRIITPDNLQLV
jgi:hypothetical protein